MRAILLEISEHVMDFLRLSFEGGFWLNAASLSPDSKIGQEIAIFAY
jgi:hypothetical protein